MQLTVFRSVSPPESSYNLQLAATRALGRGS